MAIQLKDSQLSSLPEIYFQSLSSLDPLLAHPNSNRQTIVLFPMKGFLLYSEFDLFIKAALMTDESEAYITNSERSNYSFEYTWLISMKIDEVDQLNSQGFIDSMDSALYSRFGNWSVVRSNADFAIVSGCKDYLLALKKLIPNVENQVSDLIEYSKSFSNEARVRLIRLIESLNIGIK